MYSLERLEQHKFMSDCYQMRKGDYVLKELQNHLSDRKYHKNEGFMQPCTMFGSQRSVQFLKEKVLA